MANKKTMYVGGVDKCPICGCIHLSTGGDMDKKTMKIIRWYHKCTKCGHKIYFKIKKKVKK